MNTATTGSAELLALADRLHAIITTPAFTGLPPMHIAAVADARNAFLRLAAKPAAEGRAWRADIENAPKDDVLFMLRQNRTACVACFELRGQDGGGVWLDETDAQIFPIAWMLIPALSTPGQPKP